MTWSNCSYQDTITCSRLTVGAAVWLPAALVQHMTPVWCHRSQVSPSWENPDPNTPETKIRSRQLSAQLLVYCEPAADDDSHQVSNLHQTLCGNSWFDFKVFSCRLKETSSPAEWSENNRNLLTQWRSFLLLLRTSKANWQFDFVCPLFFICSIVWGCSQVSAAGNICQSGSVSFSPSSLKDAHKAKCTLNTLNNRTQEPNENKHKLRAKSNIHIFNTFTQNLQMPQFQRPQTKTSFNSKFHFELNSVAETNIYLMWWRTNTRRNRSHTDLY